MLPTKQKATRITLAPADCILFPGTIRFGADSALTVITAYLQKTPTLCSLAKAQCRSKKGELPIAYVVAYDVEYGQLSLICAYENRVTQAIKLNTTNCNTLCRSLRKTIRLWYGMEAEDILNAVRRSNDLAPLKWLPTVTPSGRSLHN